VLRQHRVVVEVEHKVARARQLLQPDAQRVRLVPDAEVPIHNLGMDARDHSLGLVGRVWLVTVVYHHNVARRDMSDDRLERAANLGRGSVAGDQHADASGHGRVVLPFGSLRVGWQR